MQSEKVHFTKVQETLLVTLYFKALDSRSNSKDVHFVFLSFFEIISKHVIEDAPPTFLLEE